MPVQAYYSITLRLCDNITADRNRFFPFTFQFPDRVHPPQRCLAYVIPELFALRFIFIRADTSIAMKPWNSFLAEMRETL